MSEHQNFEKNRIRFEAKIRNRELELNQQKHLLLNNTSKPVITLKNSKVVESSINPISTFKTEDNKHSSVNETESFITSSKAFSTNQFEISRMFSKHWEESQIRWESQETQSLVSKEDFTKRCQLTDYTQFQRNITPHVYSQYDSSFDQKILEGDHFDLIQKHELKSSKNIAYLQRTLQFKNAELINVLVTKNDEKKILQKKIFDLQFQMFVEKRNSDQAINDIAISLKNTQGLCETQQIYIKQLSQQLKLSHQSKQKLQFSYEQRIQQLFSNINSLEICCDDLRKDIYGSNIHIQTLNFEKHRLESIIKQLEEQKMNYDKIKSLNQQLTANFKITLENIEVEQIQEQNHNNSIKEHSSDINGDSEESIQSQVAYLQNIIKQYEQQLADNRRKIKQQKKVISNLQIKLQQFEGISISLQAVNTILADVNEEIMSIHLSNLNLSFQ